MAQTRFELKEDGKYISVATLFSWAKDAIVEELHLMSIDDAICLGNRVRDENCFDPLYENNSDGLNAALEDEDPATILKLDWESSWDYFVWDGSDMALTDDIWYDLDTDDIAEEILAGEYSDVTPGDIDDIVADYREAREFLEKRGRYPAERMEGEELLEKYADGEVGTTELLQYITRLVKKDEVWRKEDN